MNTVLLVVVAWLAIDVVVVGAICAVNLRGRGRALSAAPVVRRLVPIGETSVPAGDRWSPVEPRR